MYLVGVQLGNYLFFGNRTSATERGKEWARRRVWIIAFLFWYELVIFFFFFMCPFGAFHLFVTCNVFNGPNMD